MAEAAISLYINKVEEEMRKPPAERNEELVSIWNAEIVRLTSQPPARKFTFQSHFSPAINFKYLFFILFDMLSPFISCYNPVPVIFI
jgi:hypothetical protein